MDFWLKVGDTCFQARTTQKLVLVVTLDDKQLFWSGCWLLVKAKAGKSLTRATRVSLVGLLPSLAFSKSRKPKQRG
jgi:hypothetical protein